MRHRRLIAVALGLCIAFAMASPAGAEQPGLDPDLVDRYTQLSYELEGLYSQNRAQVVGGQNTQQWLICSTGGVDAQNGSRISVSSRAGTHWPGPPAETSSW